MNAALVKRYAAWVLLVAGANAAVWFLLSPTPAQRIEVLTALLLLDNLIVLWWYAHRTEQQALTSARQFDLASEAARQANTPFVVIDQETKSSSSSIYDAYPLHNVGPGLAVNVIVAYPLGNAWMHQIAGAMGAGEVRAFWLTGEADIRAKGYPPRAAGHLAVVSFVVMSEGLQQPQWTVVLHTVARSGNVVHQRATLPFDNSGFPLTADAYLSKHGKGLHHQLEQLEALVTAESKPAIVR